MVTLTGHLTAVNGGQPLAGVSAALAGATISTDAAGMFVEQLPPTPFLSLQLASSAIVPRTLFISAASSRNLPVDAIALAGGFDLDFYRQLVRNGFDLISGHLEPLRRWTRNPQIYLRTVDEAGASIDAKTLDSTELALIDTTTTWTSGRLAASVIRGTDSREGQAGWIIVRWPAAATDLTFNGAIVCGLPTSTALETYSIQLNYHAGAGCRCAGGPEVRPRTVRHELGHALGFWHTSATSDLMFSGGPGCDAQPSARELYHAAIAYQRPVGNIDPDADPVGVVNLAPLRIP